MAHVTVPWGLLTSDNERTSYISVGGKRVPKRSKAYRQGQKHMAALARGQYDGDPLEGPVSVTLAYYVPDLRRRDVTNFTKQVMDAMSGVLFTDDKWKVCRRVTIDVPGVDRDRPRLVVTVYPLPQEEAL